MGLLWAVAALVVQVASAWGGGRKDYSRRSGSPGRGLLYSFTAAMTPAHKETIRLHPVKFGIGLMMHVGVVLVLIASVVAMLGPEGGWVLLRWLRPVSAIALLAGLYLLVRRARSPVLRAISVPDDYLAVAASCGLLAAACLPLGTDGYQAVFLAYVGLLLGYLPLGKLRHAVFFFIARGDYGRRLGYRGVYPPAPVRSE